MVDWKVNMTRIASVLLSLITLVQFWTVCHVTDKCLILQHSLGSVIKFYGNRWLYAISSES